MLLALFAALTLAIGAVNALSVVHERAAAGRPVQPWAPWVWEFTSALFWIAILLPLGAVVERLNQAGGRRAFLTVVGALLLLSVPVSLLHVLWLAASRHAIYALLGHSYGGAWPFAELVYEWRKDVVSVLAIGGLCALAARLKPSPPLPATPAAPPPFRLEVRDGARVRWLAPHEIERVEAAGNYVELHVAGEPPLLHRATLAATEEALAPHGFARVHRSRLVRRDAVRSARTLPSGDQELTLAGGATVAASRRYRLRG